MVNPKIVPREMVSFSHSLITEDPPPKKKKKKKKFLFLFFL